MSNISNMPKVSKASEALSHFSQELKQSYQRQAMVLSFSEYLDLVCQYPQRYLRSSYVYLADMFDYYGASASASLELANLRYKLFDLGAERYESVIGGEAGQSSIVDALRSFVRLGAANKLLVLHGPNGSSKSSTMDCITRAMQEYSQTDEGAVYRFCWIFPRDKELLGRISGEAREIGFAAGDFRENPYESFSGLEESKIASKIDSELKENPIYLLPESFRRSFVESLFSGKGNVSDKTAATNDVSPNLDPIFREGLSKRNQEIFERLLKAYGGDIHRVFQHVQVERFYFSRHYRVGIATVEPVVSLDARERQLTMDRYLKELPAVLQTMSFYECSGELVDGNRGVVEFSDFLKRPIESFKYLLSSIEKGTLCLPSANAYLDTVFFATTNDKHWDAFQDIPDFNSFFGRMHVLTVPYLLKVSDEMQIYAKDCELLSADVNIAPHSLYLLCLWGVMTRLKAPLLEGYTSEQQKALKLMNALHKAKLYNGDTLRSPFGREHRKFFAQNTAKLMAQFRGSGEYEGKSGASPRNLRDILHRTAASCAHKSLSAFDIFGELERLMKVKKLYEFLRLPVKNALYQPDNFLSWLKEEYFYIFEQELLECMSMVEGTQYEKLLSRYIDQVVAFVRGEKIFDSASASYQDVSEAFLKEVEQMFVLDSGHEDFRKSLLSRIAAWKIDNPQTSYATHLVFEDLLKKIKHHVLAEKEKQVLECCVTMIKLYEKNTEGVSELVFDEAQRTFRNLENCGYDEYSIVRSLRYFLKHKSSKT